MNENTTYILREKKGDTMSSIFLSHNSKDKPFVRKLASDLRRRSFYVWVDEAEIKLGDSLINKIREGIDKVEYVGVVISNDSINSEWVKYEIDIAMNHEIEGKKVKVLPIMLEKVDLPGFLKGKLYADFTTKESYLQGLKLIINRLSENPNATYKSETSKEEIKLYLAMIENLKEEINVNRGEKRLLLERLEKERRNIPDGLRKEIEREKSFLSDFEDINKYYAFVCSGMNITAGYVLHGLRKEAIKGGPHQIAMLCKIHNQTDELAILVEAVMRRLNSLKNFKITL